MNEQQLRNIIAQGENESVDLKRELHLENSNEKAEFIKDLISLANSATDIGYLIIGVDNNGDLYGTEALSEERLQQIAHTYIYPNIVLGYSNLVLDSKLIGIIEIQGIEKPHRVIKSIDRLLMNDVFVRHGSTTAKASPDEMFRMREKDTEIQREIESLTRGAEKHLKLGNIDQAIAAYSKAIELMPTSELLLARGKARMRKFEVDSENFFTSYLPVEIGELSLKDFSDALELQELPTLEKEIRLARIELFSLCPLKDKIWENDFVWAEDNISDEEYGKVMFFAALKMNIFSFYTSEGWDSDVIIKYIDLAFKLGFEDPKAYYLRASAHLDDHNLGLALGDINYAINMVKNDNC